MLQFSTEDKTMTTWRNTEADIYMKSWISQNRAVLEGKLVLGLIHLKEITQSSGYHDGFQSNCQLLDLLVFTSDVIVTDLIGARTFWWVQMVHPLLPARKNWKNSWGCSVIICLVQGGKEAKDLYYDACWLETSSMIGGNNCYFSFDMQF